VEEKQFFPNEKDANNENAGNASEFQQIQKDPTTELLELATLYSNLEVPTEKTYADALMSYYKKLLEHQQAFASHLNHLSVTSMTEAIPVEELENRFATIQAPMAPDNLGENAIALQTKIQQWCGKIINLHRSACEALRIKNEQIKLQRIVQNAMNETQQNQHNNENPQSLNNKNFDNRAACFQNQQNREMKDLPENSYEYLHKQVQHEMERTNLEKERKDVDAHNRLEYKRIQQKFINNTTSETRAVSPANPINALSPLWVRFFSHPVVKVLSLILLVAGLAALATGLCLTGTGAAVLLGVGAGALALSLIGLFGAEKAFVKAPENNGLVPVNN